MTLNLKLNENEEQHQEVMNEDGEQIFAPNHYCVHHGGVEHNGETHMAEAVKHNYNEALGYVTHYDMKLSDGTILENVAFEDIQVTNASLEEEHGKTMGKRDDKEKPDKNKDGIPDYAQDGKGANDLGKKDKEELDEVTAFLKEKEESDEGISEDSGYEEKEHDEHNAWRDEDHIEAIEKHLRALKGDRDYEEDHEKLEEEEEVETADPLKEAIKAILTKHLKG